MYYGLIAGFVVIVHRPWLPDLLGDTVVDELRVNDEAYAAALLIPLYFDVAARQARRHLRALWYLALLALPLATQAGAADSLLPDGIGGWLERTTEAFLAAIVVSLYFDFVRGDRSPAPVPLRTGEPVAGR